MDLEQQYDKLLKYCYAKVKNRELAEDIVQETFLRFWQAKSYRSMGKEMAYLYTIAGNLCLDAFKRRKETSIEDALFEAVSDESSSIEQAVTNRLLVERAMAKLSAEEREIVALHFVSELSVTDIGKILGISRFAIHRRLKAAKERLKKEMEEHA